MRKSMYMMLAAAMALMPLAAQADDNIKGGTAGAVPSFAFGLFQEVVSNDGSDVVFISPMRQPTAHPGVLSGKCSPLSDLIAP